MRSISNSFSRLVLLQLVRRHRRRRRCFPLPFFSICLPVVSKSPSSSVFWERIVPGVLVPLLLLLLLHHHKSRIHLPVVMVALVAFVRFVDSLLVLLLLLLQLLSSSSSSQFAAQFSPSSCPSPSPFSFSSSPFFPASFCPSSCPCPSLPS